MTRADVCAGILWVGATFYALFGGADFGAGFWDLVAGGAERGERPRALIQRSLTPVWEANHVWLIFILVVLWTAFPPGLQRRDDDALRADRPGRGRHRPARLRLRLPQVDRRPLRSPRRRRHLRDLLAPDPVLHGRGGRRGRLRQRPGRRQRRPLLELAGAAAAADRGDVRRQRRLPLGRLPDRRCPPCGGRGARSATSPAAPSPPRRSPASRPPSAWSSCTPKPATSSTASPTRACRW